MTRSDEPRSMLAVGMEWASRVTTVGLMFALPPLLGAFLDRWLGVSPLGILLGTAFGFSVGMMQILRIAREGTDAKPARSPRNTDSPKG